MSIAKSEPAAPAVSLVLQRIVGLAEFQLRQLALSQLGFAGELADAALEFFDRLVEAVFVRLEFCSRTEASLWKRRNETKRVSVGGRGDPPRGRRATRSVREASRGCDALPIPTSSTAIHRDSVISQRGAYLSSPPLGCWRPRRWALRRRHHLPLGPQFSSDPRMTCAASCCGRRAMRTATPIAFDELFLGGERTMAPGTPQERFAPGFTFPVSA